MQVEGLLTEHTEDLAETGRSENQAEDSEMMPDSDAILAQFNRLMQEVLRGNMHRTTFRPWEVELLLDIEACGLTDSSRRETLRRYQRAVQRHMEKGGDAPLKLSEYLEAVRAKRVARDVSAA
ncbi:MAG: hypothetical protein RL328_1880 [Acidobacteriota bacterium]